MLDHYSAQYDNFATGLYEEIRAEAFGEDIGQNGWLTRDEQDLFITRLQLATGSTLLDIACGSGGPTLRIARETGCRVLGVDAHDQAVETAHRRAAEAGLTERSGFQQLDASQRLPFEDESFDGLICVDAINHLPDRAAVLADWSRVLKPGGRLLFTDPIVVTGPLTHEEIAVRSSIGFFLFVPAGTDERLLADAGFELSEVIDRTDNMAKMADRWRAARALKENELRQIEGDETYEGQQRFFQVAATIARERRLSRFAFSARRPEELRPADAGSADRGEGTAAGP